MVKNKEKIKPRLKNLDELFNGNGDTDELRINSIAIKNLVPFKNHPFKLYEDERLKGLVESIKENGIMIPIIVRSIVADVTEITEESKYEILSGHNRVEAAKLAGVEKVPAIIREYLNDDEALIIVTETNLIQRSFADLSHSERAVALKTHMEAIKQQGKRTDLINEINELLNADKTEGNITSGQIATSLKSRDKTAAKYGLDSRNVSRYIRLSELNETLLEKVNNDEIAFIPAVSLSYLPPNEQTELNRILDENKYKVDMKKAETLRSYSENKKLTADKMIQILSGELDKKAKAKSPAPLKIKHKIYAKYFDETMKQSEMETIIDKALAEYYEKYNLHS